MIEIKPKKIEEFVNDDINKCPECLSKMTQISGKNKCFKCGIEVELR